MMMIFLPSVRSRRRYAHRGLTPYQDWLNRSSAAGVTKAVGFFQSSDVGDWRLLDAQQGNVVFESAGRPDGLGCLRINHLASDGASPGGCMVPYKNDMTGFGAVRRYSCWRELISSVTLATGSEGAKLWIGNSDIGTFRSHTECEIVGTLAYSGSWLQVYRECDPPYPSDTTLNLDRVDGGTIFLQTARDRGAAFTNQADRYCTYPASSSPGCWQMPVLTWVTFYEICEIQDYGGAPGSNGNYYSLYASIDGSGDTSWNASNHIYETFDFHIGVDPALGAGGGNAWTATIYDSNRTGAGEDKFARWSEFLNSTQPIAFPVPFSA